MADLSDGNFVLEDHFVPILMEMVARRRRRNGRQHATYLPYVLDRKTKGTFNTLFQKLDDQVGSRDVGLFPFTDFMSIRVVGIFEI